VNPTNIFQNGQKLTQFVARQPIFDAQQNVFAYELLYRDSAHNAFPVGTSDEQATSRLFFNTLMMLGPDKLTAHHLAFINLSSATILENFPKLLVPQNCVLEIVERTNKIAEVTQRVKALKQEGYKFALDDYDGDDKWAPLLAHVDYIKIEMDDVIIKTNMRIKKIKRANPHAKIIVERIETHAQFHSLKQAGCDLFQGYFFARPEMITYKDVEPGKVIVFDLLRFTAKESLCFDEIQKQVARDVAITARVLKLANARSGSTKLTITSISQAVVYLGEDSIRQLVRVLALSELGADKPSELTKLALTRAQFIALLLGQNHAELVGQGYLVGLFSVMDAILDTNLEAIVKEFSLDESIARHFRAKPCAY
jgi:EAL and modified HD-GYP domain-containing signal transduction protein